MPDTDSPSVLSERDERGVVTAHAEPSAGIQRPVRGDARGAARPSSTGVGAGRDGARRSSSPAPARRSAPATTSRRCGRRRASATTQACSPTARDVMLAIQRLPVPVIARVHGIATAAGCQLVAMCDLAVASTEARFAVSGVNCRPVLLDAERRAVAQRPPQAGDGDAAHRRFHRRRGGARPRPRQPRRRRPSSSTRRSRRWSARSSPSRGSAIAIGKEQFYRQIETGIAEAYAIAGEAMACNMMDEAALEGVQAFIDKRPPAWKRTG